jgi:hypothetical protein
VILPCIFSSVSHDGLHLRLKHAAHYATSIVQVMVLLFVYISQRNISSKTVCLHNGGGGSPLWRKHTIYMNLNLQRATYITKPQITTKKIRSFFHSWSLRLKVTARLHAVHWCWRSCSCSKTGLSRFGRNCKAHVLDHSGCSLYRPF